MAATEVPISAFTTAGSQNPLTGVGGMLGPGFSTSTQLAGAQLELAQKMFGGPRDPNKRTVELGVKDAVKREDDYSMYEKLLRDPYADLGGDARLAAGIMGYLPDQQYDQDFINQMMKAYRKSGTFS